MGSSVTVTWKEKKTACISMFMKATFMKMYSHGFGIYVFQGALGLHHTLATDPQDGLGNRRFHFSGNRG